MEFPVFIQGHIVQSGNAVYFSRFNQTGNVVYETSYGNRACFPTLGCAKDIIDLINKRNPQEKKAVLWYAVEIPEA